MPDNEFPSLLAGLSFQPRKNFDMDVRLLGGFGNRFTNPREFELCMTYTS